MPRLRQLISEVHRRSLWQVRSAKPHSGSGRQLATMCGQVKV